MGKTASPNANPRSIMSKKTFSCSKGKKFRLIRKIILLHINNAILIPIMDENMVFILFRSLLFSVTYFAVGVARSNIYTMIRTFVGFHSRVAFVLDCNTSPLLVRNTAGIPIDAKIAFIAVTWYQLSNLNRVWPFISIPIQSKTMI